VQPFARGNVAFTHNGFITKFRTGAQRKLRDSLAREAYESIEGSSDSEHIFALVLDSQGNSLAEKVRNAVVRLEAICTELNRSAVATLLLGDGDQLVGVRWARGVRPATLYWSPFAQGGVCLASEPLDGTKWRELPADQIGIARPGEELRLEPLR
jgi:glutamine amidotransferase